MQRRVKEWRGIMAKELDGLPEVALIGADPKC